MVKHIFLLNGKRFISNLITNINIFFIKISTVVLFIIWSMTIKTFFVFCIFFIGN